VQVVDVAHAVTILGADTLQSIVLQIATERLFANTEPRDGFRPRELWAHSILVAQVAGSALPSLHRGMRRSEVHSTGLLHDIGAFVMFEHLGEEYAACRREANERGVPGWEMENLRFGFHHAHVGELVARRWNLPRLAIQSIARHHDPKVVDAEDTVVPWVAAANHLASHVVPGAAGAELAEPLPEDLSLRLGLVESPWLQELLDRALGFRDEQGLDEAA
jgi:HD-like signal output (HDOD) protein